MSTIHRLLTLAILVVSAFKECQGQTAANMKDLLDDLLLNYDKRVRPAVPDLSQPTYVNASFDLVAIQEFDEVMEKLSTVSVLHIAWYDGRMVWDPSSYGNIYSVTMDPDDLWTPELVVVNQVGALKVVGESWMQVRLMFYGGVSWNPGGVVHSTCASDVTYFPFDLQECELTFVPWSFSSSEIVLIANEEKVLMTYFSVNGEWSIDRAFTEAGIHPAESFSFLNVYIHIERRPTFFLVNVILPIIFMGFLNILVFLLPAESGERLSYAITVLLAIAVFLTLVGDNMPKTSQPMSSLCYFLIINLSLSSIICVGVIYNMRLFFTKDDVPVPRWAVAMTLFCSCKRNKTKKNKVTNIDIQPAEQEMERIERKTIPTDTWEEHISACNVKNETHGVTWRDVSTVSDKLMCAVGIMWLFVSSAIFMAMVANRKEF